MADPREPWALRSPPSLLLLLPLLAAASYADAAAAESADAGAAPSEEPEDAVDGMQVLLLSSTLLSATAGIAKRRPSELVTHVVGLLTGLVLPSSSNHVV